VVGGSFDVDLDESHRSEQLFECAAGEDAQVTGHLVP
jgi:hypothetical protein